MRAPKRGSLSPPPRARRCSSVILRDPPPTDSNGGRCRSHRAFRTGDGLGLLPTFLVAQELLQARDLLAGAQDYEGVAGPYAVAGGGAGVEGALPVAGGQDHGPRPLPDPELADRVASDERVLGHAELLEPELEPFLAPGDDVQEVDDQRLRGERGKPPAANGVGGEGAVGAGYLELGCALVRAGPSDDV